MIKTPIPVYLYAIECKELRAVKIGISENVQSRLTTLQIGNPAPLVLLWQIPGSEQLENYLHKLFRNARIRGEWFTVDDPQVAAFLQSPLEYQPHPEHKRIAVSRMRSSPYEWQNGMWVRNRPAVIERDSVTIRPNSGRCFSGWSDQ